jgi:hypothetical protein
MLPLKIILRDYYRFNFTRNKINTVQDLSIWKLPFISLEGRINHLKKSEKWLNYNKKHYFVSLKPFEEKGIIHSENYTDSLLKEMDSKQIIKLFTLFNKKKHLPERLDSDFKFLNKFISLKTYCNFSFLLLNQYEQTHNPQFLNTSLKINDFLLHCQIESKDSKLNGAITDFFPCYYKSFHITTETNKLFAENLKKELFFINAL